MSTNAPAIYVQQPTPAVQVTSDEHLVNLWLHDVSANTERAYRRDVDRFRSFHPRPLTQVTLGDLQAYGDSLSVPGRDGKLALTPAGRRAIAAVKSLLTFGQQLGYFQFNVGAAVKVKRGSQKRLAERILSEADVHRMIALEPEGTRNHAVLVLLYASGVRVSELCALRWRDLLPSDDGGGSLIIEGKGNRERVIRVEQEKPWAAVMGLRDDAPTEAPAFLSRKGGPLDEVQVWRIVRAAAKRAGIDKPVSPHWLRHAHASHAIERGAPLPLVRDTLGHSSIATTDIYSHAKPGQSSGRYLAI